MVEKTILSSMLAISLLVSPLTRADDPVFARVLGINITEGWAIILGGTALQATAFGSEPIEGPSNNILGIVGAAIQLTGTLVTSGTINTHVSRTAERVSAKEIQKSIARACRVISADPALAPHSPFASIANKFDMYRSKPEGERMKSACLVMNAVAANVNVLNDAKATGYKSDYAKSVTGGKPLTPNDANIIRNLYYIYGLTPSQSEAST